MHICLFKHEHVQGTNYLLLYKLNTKFLKYLFVSHCGICRINHLILLNK